MRYTLWSLACVILAPTVCLAGVITYDIGLNTVPLIGHVAGPFAIEFQLNDGSGTGDGNNTAFVSNIALDGGAAVGSPTVTGGGSGNAATSITLTDSSFFNQFIQEFTPGNRLNFRLVLSTNVDSGGIPDQFTFAVLDSTGVEIPTLSPFNVFVQIDIDSANPLVQTFGTDTTRVPGAGGGSIDISAPIATPFAEVPEPTSLLVLAPGLLLIGYLRRSTGRIQPFLVNGSMGGGGGPLEGTR
jgi:hypothetical protein